MGFCYDIISGSARVGYSLGEGPWGEAAFNLAIRSGDPVGEVHALLVEEHFEPQYAMRIAREVAAFSAAHPDWRLVSEADWDGCVVDEEWLAVLLDEGCDPMDEYAPIYRRVGAAFRTTPAMPGSIEWENLTERQREVILAYRVGKAK